MLIKKLDEVMKPESIGRLLKKFMCNANASSMVWDERGKLCYYDFITPFCQAVYSKVPEKCEADRRKRFERAKKRNKPFLHICHAGKLNYVIPLKFQEKEGEFFCGVAGG